MRADSCPITLIRLSAISSETTYPIRDLSSALEREFASLFRKTTPKLIDSILVFRTAKKDGSCVIQSPIKLIRLSSISSETTYPITDVNSALEAHFSPLFRKRTFKLIRFDFSLEKIQNGWFVHSDFPKEQQLDCLNCSVFE